MTAAALRTWALFQALGSMARRQLVSPENEIGRAIDRAFDEFAREMRK
jgi:hypothetical protein